MNNVKPDQEDRKDVIPEGFSRKVPKKTFEEVEGHFKIAFDTKIPFLERVGNFITGESKLGRKAGAIIDLVTIFVPFGGKVEKARTAIKTIIGKKMDKPKSKSKTIWGAVILLITVILQALGVDLNANPELVDSVYQIIYALAGFWGLFGLRDAIGKRLPPEPAPEDS